MAERFVPRAQEIYRHFKGKLYQVIAVAEHTETGEMLVIYQAMYGDFKICARPLEMFVSPVDRAKYPDADQEFRFQLQGPDAQRQSMAAGAVSMAAGEETAVRHVNMTMTDKEVSERPESAAVSRETAEQKVSAAVSRETAEQKAGAAVSRETAEQKAGAAVSRETAEQKESAAVSDKEAEDSPADEAAAAEPEEPGLDPLVLEFLDADTYEQRLNVLAALHHRITNEMITTMSLCCDIEVEGDDVEQRYEELKQCLLMKERFEIKRLR